MYNLSLVWHLRISEINEMADYIKGLQLNSLFAVNAS